MKRHVTEPFRLPLLGNLSFQKLHVHPVWHDERAEASGFKREGEPEGYLDFDGWSEWTECSLIVFMGFNCFFIDRGA
jgi:hypothetical protein